MEIKCNNCKKKPKLLLPYTLEHCYGSPFDGEVWKFCCVDCMIKYLNKKINYNHEWKNEWK